MKKWLSAFLKKKKNQTIDLIEEKQDEFKQKIDRRFEGIPIGPRPPMLSFDDTTNDLMVGDILFCSTTQDEKMGELIQKVTDGPYTHCAIYSGDGWVVHMTLQGIHKCRLSEFVPCFTYVAVARCPGLSDPNYILYAQRVKDLKAFICHHLNLKTTYNHNGAKLSPIREHLNLKKHHTSVQPIKNDFGFSDKDNYFCSEFIIDCFKATGWIQPTDSYFAANKWTPNGLAEENIFHLTGFMSNDGENAISNKDPHLMGTPYP